MKGKKKGVIHYLSTVSTIDFLLKKASKNPFFRNGCFEGKYEMYFFFEIVLLV